MRKKILPFVFIFLVIISSCTTTNSFSKRPAERVPFVGTDYTELPKGTDGTAGKNASYVLFGDWPQTIKADDVTVDESKGAVVGAFIYYAGSDGAFYAKCRENSCGKRDEETFYSNGVKVAFSKPKSFKYFKVEPVKWRIITNNYNGKKLLFAENVLVPCAFYDGNIRWFDDGTEMYRNNYKGSRVRAFLNGLSYQTQNGKLPVKTVKDFEEKGFLQTAFTTELQKKIAFTNVDNSTKSTIPNQLPPDANWGNDSSVCICEDTVDKIFLLSLNELTEKSYGFGSCTSLDYDYENPGNKSRIRIPTDFAKANGANQVNCWLKGNNYRGGNWWLRSPAAYEHDKFLVFECAPYGWVNCGYLAGVDLVGVVPALCLEN